MEVCSLGFPMLYEILTLLYFEILVFVHFVEAFFFVLGLVSNAWYQTYL